MLPSSDKSLIEAAVARCKEYFGSGEPFVSPLCPVPRAGFTLLRNYEPMWWCVINGIASMVLGGQPNTAVLSVPLCPELLVLPSARPVAPAATTADASTSQPPLSSSAPPASSSHTPQQASPSGAGRGPTSCNPVCKTHAALTALLPQQLPSSPTRSPPPVPSTRPLSPFPSSKKLYGEECSAADSAVGVDSVAQDDALPPKSQATVGAAAPPSTTPPHPNGPALQTPPPMAVLALVIASVNCVPTTTTMLSASNTFMPPQKSPKGAGRAPPTHLPSRTPPRDSAAPDQLEQPSLSPTRCPPPASSAQSFSPLPSVQNNTGEKCLRGLPSLETRNVSELLLLSQSSVGLPLAAVDQTTSGLLHLLQWCTSAVMYTLIAVLPNVSLPSMGPNPLHDVPEPLIQLLLDSLLKQVALLCEAVAVSPDLISTLGLLVNFVLHLVTC